jgi:hypothetical protein
MRDLYDLLCSIHPGPPGGTGRETDTKVIETADRDRSSSDHPRTTLPIG